ncbi:hypothetical protein PIB30_096912 [Stylosanthes scabra]|uniref:Uncharacterized protein n=1 Tax=Stylosanthes scabra TaxID=79078 RepID=A0ABU6QXE4_9FABA|nr:hypothetical protein [Stylosanthes scabra]
MIAAEITCLRGVLRSLEGLNGIGSQNSAETLDNAALVVAGICKSRSTDTQEGGKEACRSRNGIWQQIRAEFHAYAWKSTHMRAAQTQPTPK